MARRKTGPPAGGQEQQPVRISGRAWEMRPIDSIIPYARNAKIHSADQVARIRGSLREFGFVRPLLIDGAGNLISGHGTLEAARAEGMETVPCVVVEGLSDTQRRAYIHADNKLAELSSWDEELLGLDLAELSQSDLDMQGLGFDMEDLVPVAAYTRSWPQSGEENDESQKEDDPGEFPVEDVSMAGPPASRRGDLWILGRHRIMCGDSTSPQDMAALLDGATPNLLLTDPPYCSGGFQEAGRKAGSIGTDRKDGQTPTIINDNLSTRGYQSLMRSVFHLLPTRFAYIFTDWRMWSTLFDVAEASQYAVRNMIVWDKQTPGMGYGWRTQHELVAFCAKDKTPFVLKCSGSNVISEKRSGNKYHPTEKPVALLWEILRVTCFADGVVDPFAGSGSTVMACEEHGLPCWAMELDPEFVDTIVRRWLIKTNGGEARCIREGQPLTPEDVGLVL